jgi:hypothetical protein
MKPHHDFRAALSSWQTPAPANDNAPLTTDSFADLAARRAYIQRAQSEPVPVLNSPTLERLGRSSPDAVLLWKFWRDLQCESHTDILIADEGGDDDDNTPPGIPKGFSAEQDLEVRPTVDELQRAWESAPARRVSVWCTVRNGRRSDVLRVVDPVVVRNGDTARIGQLMFRHGRLTHWGATGGGVPLRPVERLRAGKGSRKPQPARNLRWLVKTDAPIAKNAEFLTGEVHSTGKSGAPAECFAEREQARKAERVQLRQALGPHAEVLDMAVSDATAREIGERRGHKGKHAERRGAFLINEAFAALRALVSETILPKAGLSGP